MPDEQDIFQSADFEAAVEAAKGGTVAPVVADVPPPPAVTPAPTEPTQTEPVIAPTNYAEYLKTASEGFFESEEKFKEFIPKIKNYDSLETQLKDAQAKEPKFKNDESKAWFELLQDGQEAALKAYFNEKDKDYKTMSDADVRREALSKEHPQWSKAEVELELRTTYGENLEKIDLATIDKETDPEDYKDAVAHNKEVDRNLLLLSRDARDDRHKLIDEQSKIELPKINKQEPVVTPTGPTPEEQAERTAQWIAKVKEQLPNLQNIKQTIDNKEVEYVQSDDDKQALAAKIESFNIIEFATSRGWMDANGVPNSLKLAEDVQKLQDFEKITAAFATQVSTTTTKKVIATIKNIGDVNRQPQEQGAYDNLADAAHAAKDAAGWK